MQRRFFSSVVLHVGNYGTLSGLVILCVTYNNENASLSYLVSLWCASVITAILFQLFILCSVM